MAKTKETSKQRSARFAAEYQRQRETWGISKSVELAAAALGTSEQDVRVTIGLDNEGHYKGAVK